MASNAKRQANAACHTAQAHRRSLSLGEGAALELAARSCRAALVVIGLRPMEAQCANERPFSFITRSWCDVQASVFNAKLAQRALRGAGAPALAVTGDGA